MAIPVAYFRDEILNRSDPHNFPVPITYAGLEYAIKDNMANVANPPPYVPEHPVRLATSDFYSLFAGVAVEHRKTLAQIRALVVYRNLPQAEKERIEDDAMAFFARRYTSFVAIVIASDTTTTAANPRSLCIPLNEQIISQASRHHLLILPDSHIVSTATSNQLRILPDHPGEGFDFIDPLLKANGLSPENEVDRQDWAKGKLAALKRERWGLLRHQGISGS